MSSLQRYSDAPSTRDATLRTSLRSMASSTARACFYMDLLALVRRLSRDKLPRPSTVLNPKSSMAHKSSTSSSADPKRRLEICLHQRRPNRTRKVMILICTLLSLMKSMRFVVREEVVVELAQMCTSLLSISFSRNLTVLTVSITFLSLE